MTASRLHFGRWRSWLWLGLTAASAPLALPAQPGALQLPLSGAASVASASPATAPSGAPRGAKALNLILISLTNTRADHLGAYGYSRNTSPHLDRLARKSLVFRNAFSHASWTLPAIVSLLTSQYPFTHGLMDRQEALALPGETVTLVDVLKANGYLTAAFVGNRDYSPKFGHTSRFDLVFEPVHDDAAEDWKSYGVLHNVLPPARDWLKQHRDRKFCLLVQGYDTHCPFAVPRENRTFSPNYQGAIDFTKCYWTFARSSAVRIRTPTGEYQEAYLLKTRPTDGDDYEVMFNREDIDHMVALYDGEILNADAQIGSLLQDITELGLERNTVVVFYADHGDMFGKHGRFMRGGPLRGTFYDDVLRIPLLVYHPDLEHRDVEALVQLIDLAPSLLDWLGCPIPGSFRGKSFTNALGNGGKVNDFVFAGSAFTPSAKNPFFRHSSVISSVRSREWKLIHERLAYSVGAEEHLELYDLRRDPQELENLAAQQPAVLGPLKAELLRWFTDIHADKFKPPWK
jgi:arylsulfatase A-like enzyme